MSTPVARVHTGRQPAPARPPRAQLTPPEGAKTIGKTLQLTQGPWAGAQMYAWRTSKNRLYIRPWSNTAAHGMQAQTSVHRALIYLCWGPPAQQGLEACHFACDYPW